MEYTWRPGDEAFNGAGILAGLRQRGAISRVGVACNRRVGTGVTPTGSGSGSGLIGGLDDEVRCTAPTCTDPRDPRPGAQFTVTLPDGLRLRPSHYALQHGLDLAPSTLNTPEMTARALHDTRHLKHWVLEGAAERRGSAQLYWTVLSRHDDEVWVRPAIPSLKEAEVKARCWPIQPAAPAPMCTAFRLRMTGVNSGWSHELAVSGIELYGVAAPEWWTRNSHSEQPTRLQQTVLAMMMVGVRARRSCGPPSPCKWRSRRAQVDESCMAPAPAVGAVPAELWAMIFQHLRYSDYGEADRRLRDIAALEASANVLEEKLQTIRWEQQQLADTRLALEQRLAGVKAELKTARA